MKFEILQHKKTTGSKCSTSYSVVSCSLHYQTGKILATRYLFNGSYINLENTSKSYTLQQVVKLKTFLHLKGRTKVAVGNNFFA